MTNAISAQASVSKRKNNKSSTKTVVAKIPKALKNLEQWVACRYEKEPNGKWSKRPVSAKTGIAKNWPANLSSFEVAQSFANKNTCGLGFNFNATDGLIGIDIDGCRDPESGDIESWGKEVIDQFETYAEVSVSGTGVKIILKASLPVEKTITKSKYFLSNVPRHGQRSEIELKFGKQRFDGSNCGKYFAMTGDLLPSKPSEINNCQEAFLKFIRGKFKLQKLKKKEDYSGVNGLLDIGLLDRVLSVLAPTDFSDDGAWFDLACEINDTFGSEAGIRFQNWSLKDPEHLDNADENLSRWESLTPGLPNNRTIDHLIARLESSGSLQQAAIAKELASARARLDFALPPQDENREKPSVLIDEDEAKTVDEVLKALARLGVDSSWVKTKDQDKYRVFCRSSELVEVVLKDGLPRIAALRKPIIRERISQACSLFEAGLKGKISPVRPHMWIVDAVEARNDYTGIPEIRGVCCNPTLRADGSVLQTPGFDTKSGLFYKPTTNFERVKNHPTRRDAENAIDDFFHLVSEFPFQSDADRSAWLCLLLSIYSGTTLTGPYRYLALQQTHQEQVKGFWHQWRQ